MHDLPNQHREVAARAIWVPDVSFNTNFNTSTTLHKIIKRFYSSIQYNKIVGMLGLDLRKAFDTVNHNFFFLITTL